MLPLLSSKPTDTPLQVLCLGAHSDDIEIGCGASLMALAEQFPAARFHWVVFTTEPGRDAETRAAAAQLLAPARLQLQFVALRPSYLPAHWSELKDHFEALKAAVSPDMIFTHRLEDRHQDHRLIAEMTWTTFRNHLVLEYEIPKYEGDLGQPNVFVPVSKALAEHKIAILMSAFVSQQSRSWFDPETFRGLMRLRGVECQSASGYAEAFHGRKLQLLP
jgi:LmbE family N-acetylglucosaminyl deacetylase